ncbi:hypothetical protein BGZ79_009758 [Entomortierella chlamydospora]|nr:hypothetical protein BGZ79_009758 [Entomortierella chlamydospora]
MASQSSARDRCLDIPELINKLASMLNLQDFAVCMQVCRHWQQLWVRHLFATSYGPAQAPYFPQHGHHVQTLDWRKTFLPEDLDLPRIHCGNLKIILLPRMILTWDDFWIHFLGLDPQTIPTSPSFHESPNDDDLVEQLELGDKESKEWDRELSSLKGETNAFLSDSIEVMSLRTPFASLILGSLAGARVLGDDILPNLKELTMTDESPDRGKSALKPRHILAFLDAFPSLERLIFSNINFIHDGDDSRSKEPCPSCPLSYAMSQTTSNLSELSLPQIDSLLALSQVLRLVPRLQWLTLQQTWYSASVLQVVQLSCPDLHTLHLYSRMHSSDKAPPSAFLPSWPSSLSPRGDSLGVDSLNGFQKLKTLRLIMANITDQGLAFLLSGMSGRPASSSSFSSTSQLQECMYFYRRLGLEDQLYRGLRTVPEWRPSWESIRYLVNTCSWLRTLRIIGEMKLPVDVFAPSSWACAGSLELLIIRVKLRGIKENRILQRNLATLKNLRHLAIGGTGILPEALVNDPNETEAEGNLRPPLWPHMKELSMGFDTDRQMSEQQLKLLLDMVPKVKSLDIDAGVTSSASKWVQINRPDLRYRLVCRGG